MAFQSWAYSGQSPKLNQSKRQPTAIHRDLANSEAPWDYESVLEKAVMLSIVWPLIS